MYLYFSLHIFFSWTKWVLLDSMGFVFFFNGSLHQCKSYILVLKQQLEGDVLQHSEIFKLQNLLQIKEFLKTWLIVISLQQIKINGKKKN